MEKTARPPRPNGTQQTPPIDPAARPPPPGPDTKPYEFVPHPPVPDPRTPGDARPETEEEKAYKEWGNRLVKVRMATRHDQIQYMHTVKDGYGKHANDVYDGVSDTQDHRRDWDRVGLTKKKIKFRQMDITFMTLTETNDSRGRMVKVGLRHGNALSWEPEDVVAGAVDELMVPVKLLVHLRENVNKGFLYVEDVNPEAPRIPKPLPLPVNPEAATVRKWDKEK